ncbi:MAG: PEP-CTERM sorting domain-containing protein [Candidatus Aureabacteria bacterium]|nr:PEP-CTERM sorting domain-containing protein [Candidatus Auribacterota bacterium]
MCKFLLSSFLVLLCVSPLAFSEVASWTEDFSSPSGWTYEGETGTQLFTHNGTQGNVNALWKSDKSTSRYYKSLGGSITESSSFSFGCDLQINDLVQNPWGMQIGFGLFNTANTGDNRVGYYDGDWGYHSGNTINTFELSYFPYQDGWGGPWFGGTIMPEVDNEPGEPGNQVKIVYSGETVTYKTVGFDEGELPYDAWLYTEATYDGSSKEALFSIYTNQEKTTLLSVNGQIAQSSFIYTGDAFSLDALGFFSYYDYLDSTPVSPSLSGVGIFDNAYFNVVPEPSSWICFTLGLVSLWCFKRKKTA